MTARLGAAILLVAGGLTTWSWRANPTRERAAPSAAELAEAAAGSPTTLIVDFRDDIPAHTLAHNGFEEQPLSRFSVRDRLYRISFRSPAEALAAIDRLRRDPMVESVDHDVPVGILPDTAGALAPAVQSPECAGTQPPAAGFPDDPCFRYQWHLGQVGLPAAWRMGRGEGVTVAVIDTGVSHVPDLAGTRFAPGYDFVGDTDRTDDEHGHGTHVAGTIAQATNNRLGVAGVAFRARIMPLKVLSARGAGSMAAVAQAIRFAADNGAQVINMSLGGPFPVSPVRRAIDYARTRGVVVVAAAGNDGRGRVSYPARYPGVIAVAATQLDESTTFYSNWGAEIDIAAPGGNLRVDQNGDGKPDGVLQNTLLPGARGESGYLWFMGTSMAAPHVAGVAALVAGAGVTRPEALEKVLLDTARRPKARGERRAALAWGGESSAASEPSRSHYGAGIVDAAAALGKARSTRGGLSLGLGTGLALIGMAGRRRMRLGRARTGFAAALVLGASGLFFLPQLAAPAWLWDGPLGLGVLAGAASLLGPAAQGNPLLWSALLPLAAASLLFGVRSLRPALAGLAFGVAGALLFAALAYTADVRWIPAFLDRAWLGANALCALLLGSLILRR